MYIDADTIIKAAAVLVALTTLIGGVIAIYKFYNKCNKMGDDLKQHEADQENEIKVMKEEQSAVTKAIQAEQCLITYGLLACLKGLSEQGCNGPVTEAIKKIEKHINLQAHDQEG